MAEDDPRAVTFGGAGLDAGDPQGTTEPGAGEAGQGSTQSGGPRTRHKRRHRFPSPLRLALLALGVLVAGLAAWTGLWFSEQLDPGAEGPAVVVTIRSGSGIAGVATELSKEHVISSSLALRVYLLVKGAPFVEAGGYLMHRNEGLALVSAELAAGPDVFDVTVDPGLTVAEVARLVGDLPGRSPAGFMAAVRSGLVRSPWQPASSTNLDGLLGTGTFQILPGEPYLAVLRDMVNRFVAQADAAHLDRYARALGVSPYQALTVASIVQKEGVYTVNDAKVARVVYNRLARGMPLQMDSTVLYSLGQDGGTVTPADLRLDTPYNTYLHTGLPPTPIAFPSAAALHAALHPAAGSWLYFVVVTRSGLEAFSDTYAGQLANEALARSRGLG